MARCPEVPGADETQKCRQRAAAVLRTDGKGHHLSGVREDQPFRQGQRFRRWESLGPEVLHALFGRRTLIRRMQLALAGDGEVAQESGEQHAIVQPPQQPCFPALPPGRRQERQADGAGHEDNRIRAEQSERRGEGQQNQPADLLRLSQPAHGRQQQQQRHEQIQGVGFGERAHRHRPDGDGQETHGNRPRQRRQR